MLNTGDTVKDFSLNDDQGNPASLVELLGAGPLILYFYPADFTPGCTTEACQIRDIHDEVLEVGIQVIGVSPQSEKSHQRFIRRNDLPFKLLCDPGKKVIREFGVDGPLGFGVRRATFLIGTDMKIEDRVVADIKISNHVEFIKQIVKRRA